MESVIKAVKTINFTRVRIGISATNAKGWCQKSLLAIIFWILLLGKFKPAEMSEMKKSAKKSAEALSVIVSDGTEKAMGSLIRN